MNYYQQSFQRLYENFVFSLNIYRDRHLKSVLYHQILEKLETLVTTYEKLGIPKAQLLQWQGYYAKRIHNAYQNGGKNDLL
ncbi:hypothetical protein SCQ32_04850 [Streptococcus canis]|uniref:hypothetical protein n=1 Tax=Streptococcus canis TaxID=1329 RepID=UPI0029990706|nr:hypothetical protein [Streptococcus canis]